MHAVQPVGNDTIVTAWHEGQDQARVVESHTRISGLAVPTDIDASRALAAIRTTGGSGVLVDDTLVWEVQRDLARHEGIYVEPAGAVSVTGLWRAVREERFQAAGPIVCVLTGHGFKDPAAIERLTASEAVPLIDAGEIGAAVASPPAPLYP
jgi:threonine synthase